MSSINAIIGAVSRAIHRVGKKAEFRTDSTRQFEADLLDEAAVMTGPAFSVCLAQSINDIWNKPARITVDEKKKRQGQLREVLSLITPHDTPLEYAIAYVQRPRQVETGQIWDAKFGAAPK